MRIFLTAILAAALFAALGASSAQAVDGPTFEIWPLLPAGTPIYGQGEVIPIPPDDVEEFWAHIIWPGHEGEMVHIFDTSWDVTVDPDGAATSEVIEWYAEPCVQVPVCEPFPWNLVHTTGRPCTYITFQADVAFHDAAGNPWGPIWSNTVVKHIVPEPASLMVLGITIVGAAGTLRRRK